MLAWDNKYELGHQRIDAEHRIFLSLLSDFQMAMEQGLCKHPARPSTPRLSPASSSAFLHEEFRWRLRTNGNNSFRPGRQAG